MSGATSSEFPIVIEQAGSVPDRLLSRIASDTAYVRLGCEGCRHEICFTAQNMTSFVPDYSRDKKVTHDLLDIVDMVDVHTVSGGEGTNTSYPTDRQYDSDVCAQGDSISVAVELVNERFNANLII